MPAGEKIGDSGAMLVMVMRVSIFAKAQALRDNSPALTLSWKCISTSTQGNPNFLKGKEFRIV